MLVDDLDREALTRMARDGVALACVTETSPGNHQAWIRLWIGDARDESAVAFGDPHRAGAGGPLWGRQGLGGLAPFQVPRRIQQPQAGA